MSTIPKAVGKISLRDFKTLFDRPGFYRYHFKTMDKEFGMVKEEVRIIPKKIKLSPNQDILRQMKFVQILTENCLFRSLTTTKCCQAWRGRS